MTPSNSNAFFNFGVSLAGAQRGLDKGDIMQKRAREAVMTSEDAAPFHRELCKIAYAAFQADGAESTPEAVLFLNLSKEATWHRSYNRFTGCVLRSLSKMEKSGAMLLPAVAALHDNAGGGAMKTLTAGTALGGAALGSLAFLLSRNARQSSAENAAILEKVKTYKQLRRDIQEDMAAEDVMNPDATEQEGERYDV